MADLTITSHRNSTTTPVDTKSRRRTRDGTMLTKVTKPHESGVRSRLIFVQKLVRLMVNMLIVLGVICEGE